MKPFSIVSRRNSFRPPSSESFRCWIWNITFCLVFIKSFFFFSTYVCISNDLKCRQNSTEKRRKHLYCAQFSDESNAFIPSSDKVETSGNIKWFILHIIHNSEKSFKLEGKVSSRVMSSSCIISTVLHNWTNIYGKVKRRKSQKNEENYSSCQETCPEIIRVNEQLLKVKNFKASC